MFDKVEYNFYGTDKEGRPVRITKVPPSDLKEIFDQCELDDWLDLQVMIMERVEKIVFRMCSEKFKKPISKGRYNTR